MADWQQPYQQRFFDRAQQVGNAPYQPFGESTQVGANPWQTAGWTAAFNRGMRGAPEVSAAREQMTNTIGGKGFETNPYLQGSNPFLQQTIDSTLGDITRQYNLVTRPAMTTANARSGSFGNSGLAEMEAEQQRNLAQELGRASGNLRFADYQQRANLYENERNRQQAAMLGAPNFANVDYADIQAMQQAGGALQGQQQLERTADYNQYLDAREWPYKTLGAWGGAMGSGGGPVTPPTPKANKGANVLGGALAGAQLGGSLGIGSGWGALGGGLLGLLGG